jgi:hypothetical protein
MKQRPIIGTAGTENIPPVTTPVPYKRSQVPGIALVWPAFTRTIVNNAPAMIGGDKLNTAFRPGPDINGMSTARDFLSIDQPAMSTEMNPSAIQTVSHPRKVD